LKQARVFGVPRRRAWAGRWSVGVAFVVALGTTCLSKDAEAQIFPPNGSWAALKPVADVSGDATPLDRDIVGNAANPVSYVYSDGTHLYFRLRVNATALTTATNFTASSWGCVIDTNQDAKDYEFSAILDGAAAADTVKLSANTVQAVLNDPTDAPEVLLKTYLGPLVTGQQGFGYARQASAGTVFPLSTPDADFFVDWAVERSAFGTGLNAETIYRFACGTGAAGVVLGTDFAGAPSLPTLLSDPYLCGSSGCIPQTCAGFGQACSVGVGACTTTGKTYCNSAGQPYCSAFIGEPSAEICNGIDDNCDGTIDDNNPGGGVACTTGLAGICNAGSTNCSGGALQCTPSFTPGQKSELCNNLDDDCDGQTDEGFGLGTTCSVGLGAC